MLKLFRKYNKYILAFGASILMVAFLVQGTVSMWMPSGLDTPIGTIEHGKVTITAGNRRTATVELKVLEDLGLGQFPPLARRQASDQDLRFYLLTYEARKLGLSASEAEVKQVLQAMGAGKAQISQLTDMYHIKPAFVDQAVRHWLMIEAYRQLALGNSFANVGVGAGTPGLRMLELRSQFYAALKNHNYGMIQAVQAMMRGAQRVSRPLVRHFLQDVFSRASGSLVLVDSSRYLKKVAKPGEQQLKKLFDQYKGALPGQGDPYGFGYRIPNRVKIEYMVIPLSAVRKTVNIGEADALTYYDHHRDQFVEQPTTAASQPSTQPTKIKPYTAVREQIFTKLRNQKAHQLASQMVKTAQSLMLSDVRQYPQTAGYRKLPQDFKPAPMQQIADQIQQQFHIKPKVYRDTSRWVTGAQLASLPVIGDTSLGSGRNAHSFRQYVLSAKELKPSTDNPLVARRLQVGVPSDPLTSSQADVIFRLTAAEPTRVPASLKAVRGQVAADARRLEAYHMLLGRKDALLKEVATKGMDQAAAKLKLTVLPFKNIPLRIMQPGMLLVPHLPAVGQSAKVVDDIFQTAYEARQQQKGSSFAAVARRARIGAVGVPTKLGMAIFEVDKYHQITRKQFRQYEQRPDLTFAVSNAIETTANTSDPLSLTALKARLGYHELGGGGGPAPAAKSPGNGQNKPQPVAG